MNLIMRAAKFAAACHRDQKRKYNGRPYITHPCRVAGRVAIHPLADEEGCAVAAAFLHDVVEDCEVLPELIDSGFGETVCAYVCWLTNPSKGSKAPRAERKAMDRKHAAEAPPIVKVIKLIDRIDNLREIDPTDSFTRVYCHETLLLLEAVGDADKDLADELRLLVSELVLAPADGLR